MRKMRILVACEMSARVRDAFRLRGHDAWSIDLLPTMGDPRWHIQGDALEHLGDGWDLLIAFPPCIDLANIGAVSWKEKQADGRQERALDFVRALMDAPVLRIAIENPVGRINSAIRKPDQIVHPYMFGDAFFKRTCLWLKGLPPLYPDNLVEPRAHWIDGGSRRKYKAAGEPVIDDRYGHRSDAERKIRRSMTFCGLARAMSEQWGIDDPAAA
jgi:hypothetical protein